MSKPCVATLCEYSSVLGGENSLLAYFDAGGRTATEPVVVAPAEGPLAAELARRGIARVDWPSGGKQNPAAVAEVLKPFHVELIHANSLMLADAAAAIGIGIDVPCIVHVRDMMRLSAARWDRLATVCRFIAVSRAVGAWLVDSGIAAERIAVIPNAFDVPAFRSNYRSGTLRSELGVARDTRLIACIGQICLRKAQEIFLAAAKLLAAQAPNVHFVIVGERYSTKRESVAFADLLHQMAARPPLAGLVHFLGQRDDVPTWIADLDVIAVTSRQEPFSRVLLEALASGVPAVGARVGGNAEILRDVALGILVPPDDPPALAAAIKRLLDDLDLRTRLRQAGPPWIADLCDPPTHLGKMLGVIDQALSFHRHQ